MRKGLLLALSTLTLLLTSCSRQQTPMSPAPESSGISDFEGSAPLTFGPSVIVRGYSVRYDGRTVASGKTTFTYTVSGTGCDPTLSNFVIQLPPCAPAVVYSSPSGASIGNDPITCWYGVKWSQSLGTNASRTYSIKFSGDVPEGLTRVAVKAGHGFDTAVVPGPCGGFVIEGIVFVDSDGNGSQDPADEPGQVGVTVTLVDGAGTASATTDANGSYSFRRLDGTYTVRIDATTAASDFNEDLFQSFSATTATSVGITLGPDATVDFGFKPQTAELTTDLNEGVLTSTGVPAKFWIKVFKDAKKGKSQDGFTPASLIALLNQIEGAFFSDVYQFTPGSEFQEALDLLDKKPKDPIEDLRRELFVTELNHFSGKGIVGHAELMASLQWYGESLIVDRTGPAARMASGARAPAGDSDVAGATELYRAINNARGGGDVPQ